MLAGLKRKPQPEELSLLSNGIKGMDSLTVTDRYSEALCKYFCHTTILLEQAKEKRAVNPTISL
jgi:hypothetical protein